MLSQSLKQENIYTQGYNNFLTLLAMTKPTITLLVVITCLPAIFMASDSSPNIVDLILTLLGAAGCSGSAAVFNQIFETDIDKKMKRTKTRSLPTKKISIQLAISFGIGLGALSFCLLYFCLNPLTAYIAASGHLFYVFVYTLFLKKRTPQNIVIGGIAGAIGPLIGCASVSNSLSPASWILFLIIVLWTPPHFWALCLKYKKDYAQAGIPMYPIIYGDDKTRRIIFLYTLTLIPCIFALAYINQLYMITSLICFGFSLKFSIDALKLYRTKNNLYAMPLFYFSCIYTFALFILFTIDRMLFLSYT